jgi:phosphosulfolactate synthase
MDCLEAAGAFIDEAKIAAGIGRLMSLQYLKKKITVYNAEGILTFPGGLFAELAIAQGNFEVFLDGAREAGFSAIEISDNLLRISSEKKKAVISKAAKDFGFKVMGEVGKKEGSVSGEEMIRDIEGCLQAGALKVLLEAHELFSGEIKKDIIEMIAKRVPLDCIIFELPVLVLPGSSRDLKHRVLAWLVKEFGTEVNIANVEWDEIFITELVRRGMAGDTSHPQGAYRLAGMR